MKVILWMAMSLNGIIARENNEEDFISHNSWLEWLKWVRKSGCVIWGRKTHEVVRGWDKQYLEDLKGVKVVVVSADKNYKVGEGFELASSPEGTLEKLAKDGFESAVVTGGATLNSSFAKAGLIDEVVLNVEPVIIGKGIPLFSPEIFDLKLQLVGTEKLKDGIVQLHYKVKEL
jgi:dihydrofolate reductase